MRPVQTLLQLMVRCACKIRVAFESEKKRKSLHLLYYTLLSLRVQKRCVSPVTRATGVSAVGEVT